MIKYYLMTMAFIGSGFIIAYHLLTGSPLEKVGILLMKEVGMALIIGILLYYFIESKLEGERERQTRNFIERLTKSFFKTVFQHHVPSSVWHETESTLLSSLGYMRAVDIDYVLTPIDGCNTHLKIDVVIKYDLVNGTDNTISLPINYGLDTSLIGSLEHQDLVEIKSFKVWRSNKLKEPEKLIGDSSSVSVDFPVFVNANTHAQIEIKATTVKRVSDVDIISFSYPCEDISLTIQIPNHYTVSARANNSNKLELHKNNGNNYVYQLQGGVFPYQSLVFSWFRNRKS